MSCCFLYFCNFLSSCKTEPPRLGADMPAEMFVLFILREAGWKKKTFADSEEVCQILKEALSILKVGYVSLSLALTNVIIKNTCLRQIILLYH